MFFLIAALMQVDDISHMQAYSPIQLEGLAHLYINVYKTSSTTAQLFFSTWLFPLGYLVYKSGFLPPRADQQVTVVVGAWIAAEVGDEQADAEVVEEVGAPAGQLPGKSSDDATAFLEPEVALG